MPNIYYSDDNIIIKTLSTRERKHHNNKGDRARQDKTASRVYGGENNGKG
jgi:hypothetical protein